MAKTGRKKRSSGLPVPVTNGSISDENRQRQGGGGGARSGTRSGDGTGPETKSGSETRPGSKSGNGKRSKSKSSSSQSRSKKSESITQTFTDSLTKISERIDRPAAALWYHTLISIGLFISGVLLVVLGSWSISSRFGRLALLPITSPFVRRVIRSTGGVCLGIGILCILCGALGCAALLVSGAKYGFLALGILSFIGLCLIAVCGWLLASRAQSVQLRADLATAWVASPVARFAIQAARRCQGFDLADQNNLRRNNGCYFAMTNLMLGVSIPTALGSSMCAILLLLDFCVVFLI